MLKMFISCVTSVVSIFG